MLGWSGSRVVRLVRMPSVLELLFGRSSGQLAWFHKSSGSKYLAKLGMNDLDLRRVVKW